jgi:type III pantothenate kinase
MLNLAVDIGNTAIKYALFKEEALVHTGQVAEEILLTQRPELTNLDNIIFSSVRGEASALETLLPVKGQVLQLNYQMPVPVNNLYQTPETLGMDRLAAVVGANFLFPEFNCLVIDAGTCITCDFIDREKNYQGGSIGLGLAMKFQALHTFTQKLPLVEQTQQDVPLAGRNTTDAIRSGVLHGTIAELNGIIAAYAKISPELMVVICGGDAAFFETNLKAHIFVVPELVLIGLNRILNYNV